MEEEQEGTAKMGERRAKVREEQEGTPKFGRSNRRHLRWGRARRNC